MIKVRLRSVQFADDQIHVKVKTDVQLTDPVLVFRARKEAVHTFSVSPCRVTNHGADFEIPMSQISPENLYYDLWLEAHDGDEVTDESRIRSANGVQRRMFNFLHLKHGISTHEGIDYLITAYFAAGGKLSLQIRQRDVYDQFKYHAKEWLACLLLPFVYWYYRGATLTYEKLANLARDNSYYYFKYVQDTQPQNQLYYLIHSDSPDLDQLRGYHRRVVIFMSLKHMLLILSCRYFVAAESKGHAYAWRHNQGPIRYVLNRKPFVFLQHGVLGLKQVDHTFFADNRLNHADLFMTSSQVEKQIVEDYLGYRPEQIAVTGLARWDNPAPVVPQQKIFLMPTWRTQLELVTEAEFCESEFYRTYMDLINSPKLNELLKQTNTVLDVMLHPKFTRFESLFRSDNPKIRIRSQASVSLDVEIRSSQLVITDYSSIMWDALYLGIPVYLFQFDQAEYLALQGSYLDFSRDLPNMIVKQPDELVEAISNTLSGQVVEPIAELQQRYFKAIDKQNSQRIDVAIRDWQQEFKFPGIMARQRH